MVLLTLSHVYKAFVMNQVLTDVSLTLQKGGRMGLVGLNGSGKSTLLKLITGELEPDEGEITMIRGTTVGLLTQHSDIDSSLTVTEELSRVFEPLVRMEERLREMEAEMTEKHENAAEMARLTDAYDKLTRRFEDEGGYEYKSRVQGVLAGLGFDEKRREQPSHLLSGGEKTRLCLARLLLQKPDLLLLDEPTNHLDLASTQWLEDTIKKYKGTVLVISHDRYFLNEICDSMAEIRQTRLTQYSGNYDAFAEKREADLERQLKEYNMQQAEIERQQAIIRRYRMFNREKSIKAAESRERRLEKIERLDKPVDDKHVRFRFEARRRSGDDVMFVNDLKKSFDGRTLFENFNLHVRSGDRIVVIGPNGVGKTTLLNIIMKRLAQDSGTIRLGANVDIGYYDQQQADLHPEKDIMSEVWDDFPQMEPGRVRDTLALFLLTGEDVFRKVGTLSGGERGRVALAKLMLKKNNVLILDEPTNHLDMDSREVLEGALDGFEGTIVAVSHDRYFINRIADKVVEMTKDGVCEYEGNYDNYLERKRKEAEGINDIVPGGETKTQLDKQRKRERMRLEDEKARNNRLLALEAEIAKSEARIAEIEAEMGAPDTWQNYERAAALDKERREIQESLEGLYEEWMNHD